MLCAQLGYDRWLIQQLARVGDQGGQVGSSAVIWDSKLFCFPWQFYCLSDEKARLWISEEIELVWSIYYNLQYSLVLLYRTHIFSPRNISNKGYSMEKGCKATRELRLVKRGGNNSLWHYGICQKPSERSCCHSPLHCYWGSNLPSSQPRTSLH